MMKITTKYLCSHEELKQKVLKKIDEIENAMPVTCVGIALNPKKMELNHSRDVFPNCNQTVRQQVEEYEDISIGEFTLVFEYNEILERLKESAQ